MYYIVYKYIMFNFFSKIWYVKNWIEVYKYDENRNLGIIKINKISEKLYILKIKYEYLLRIIKFIFIYIFFISIIVSYG